MDRNSEGIGGNVMQFGIPKFQTGKMAKALLEIADLLTFLVHKSSTNQGYRLRRNPPDAGVTSGQKPCTKIIYIVLQTSVGLW